MVSRWMHEGLKLKKRCHERNYRAVVEGYQTLLTLGPVLSTRTPANGARIYSMNIDTDPIHEMSDSDLSCITFAL